MIELVVVIVIIAIIAYTAISRFSGPSTYSIHAAQAQAISVIQQVQMGRMQSKDQSAETNSNYVLSVSDYCLGSQHACQSGDDNLSAKITLPAQSQSLKFSSALALYYFDLYGRPTALCPSVSDGILPADYSDECDLTQQVKITISDLSDASKIAYVCINAQGFVYPAPMTTGACNK